MKIRYKIILSFIAVGLSIALASYIVLHSLEEGPRNITEFQTSALYLIHEMSTCMEEALYQSISYILTKDPDKKIKFYQYISEFDMSAEKYGKIIMADKSRSNNEAAIYDAILSGRNSIIEKAEKLFEEIEIKGSLKHDAIDTYSNLIEKFDSDYAQLLTVEKEHVENAQKASLDAIKSAHNAHSSIVLFSILSSVAIGWLISRTISMPIRRLKNAAVSIAQGDLDVNIEICRKKDEIGDLANAFQDMKGNLLAVMETLKSEIKERREAEDALKKLNEDLEHRVYARTVYLEFANTELEKTAHVLEEQETHLRTILDNVFESIFTVDESGTIASCNLATSHIFGWKTDELIGKHIGVMGLERFFSGNAKKDEEDIFHNGEVKNTNSGHKTIVKRKDGSMLPAEFAFNEVQLQDKRMFICIVKDITEREKIDNLKNEFISTVSHELRTPLASIIGALGLIVGGMTGDLSPKAMEMVEIAYKNGKRLTNLVNDILDIQKIESGRMVFDIKPIELMPLLVQAIEDNKVYAQLFRVKLRLVCTLFGLNVNVDGNRFIQVITNLISNAVKHSLPDDTVTLSAVLLNGKIHIDVTDHGPGIPQEFRSRIFQKFTQADSSTARQKGGTGLGLSIAKAIVEKHGGRIGFISEPNVETNFWVELDKVEQEVK